MPVTPIVLIHKGNSWYLPYTIWQLLKTNPDTPIYLIGDKQTHHFKRWINHIDLNQFKGCTLALEKVYQHHSTLGAEFELTCIERWFILLEFLKQNNLKKCIYLDSDILVYKDLNKVEKNFPTYDMTWCGFSAHSNFIKNIAALENYCNNVIDCYTNNFPSLLKEKSHFYQVKSSKLKMNISDMSFFHDYNLRYPGSLLDISLPNLEGTFDRSMEDTRVFEAEGEFKKVYWVNIEPFCLESKSGIKIPFVTLHFQGKGKNILKEYFKYNSLQTLIMLLKNYLIQIINKF